MTDKRLLMTTASSRQEADTLATELVSRRLAACVNILGPLSSVYRWQGEIERSEEFLLLIKSTEERCREIQQTLGELHSYELPELISFAIDSGLDAYLEWIAASVRR